MKLAMSRAGVLAAISLLVLGGIRIVNAQQAQPTPSVKRTVLLKQDMTIPGREAVMGLVELPPGATEGRHTHSAELYAYVQEGTVTLEREGQPTVTLKAGDTFSVAPGQIHQGTNRGTATARVLAVFFAEKGKPLTTQVQ